ncbi:MAG: 30S ribosomal protein S1 [Candidatus Humimicrobiaceae bacterium]|jgi:small subunit ribosomal protein S1|nr:30S ribosomal protein S1 [Actinomycetota bacterium]MDD5601134.1 30S ribosomal protein S1 [Actinomycetota bacterium]MDY0027920.1 30S ribosomal protein S1 [Candidatus Humimicrobiaceae bacterium]
MTEKNFTKKITNENYMVEDESGRLVPNYDLTMISLNDGDIIRGKVVKIDKDEVLVDVGFKSEGVIPLNELSIRSNVKPEDILKVDDEIEIMVLQKEDQDGRLILSKKRAEVEQNFDRIEKIYQSGETVEGEIIECVKGGLIVDIGLRGFLPASLIDIRKTKDLESYIGEKCICKIIEVDRNRNNVVLSRKVIIEDEKKEQRKEILSSMEVGQIRKGLITSIADFGAFVDVGGVDGLIHISELSWNHVKHPSEVVSVDQEVDVEILDIDYEKQRLSLGLKQTQKDPWVEKIKKYSVKDMVMGKVTRIVKFGLFVEIEDGIEGLVHISELSDRQVKRPSDVAKIGDELMVRIIDIDYDRRRMAFSIRQVENPVEEKEEKTSEKERKTDSGEEAKASKVEDKEIKEVEETATEDTEKAGKDIKDKADSVDTEDLDTSIEEEKISGEDIEDNEDSDKKRKIEELVKEMKDEANLE